MKRRKKDSFVPCKQAMNIRFFARELRLWKVAKLTIAFSDNSGKTLGHMVLYDDPKARTTIIRWRNGRYFLLPYKSFHVKSCKMNLAKFKYLKSRLA